MKYFFYLFFICSFATPILVVAQTENTIKENPWLTTCKLYYAQGNYPLALNAITQFLKPDPLNWEGLYWRGKIESRMLNFNDAFDDLNLANKLYPKQAKTMAALAELYDYFGDYEKAFNLITAALIVEPTNLSFLNIEGLVLLHQKKFNAAFLIFDNIILRDSTDPIAFNNRGTARFNNQSVQYPSKEDLKNAEHDFSKAIELSPTFAMAYRNRGVVRLGLNDYNNAYQDLIIARRLDPKDEKVYYNLGKIYNKLGKNELAIEAFNNAIKISTIFCEPYLERGLTHLSMGNYESGRSDFRKSIAVDKNSKGRANYYIAKSYALEKNKVLCIEYLKNAKKTGFFVNFDNRNELIKDTSFNELLKDEDFRKARNEIIKIK
ncbi:MAG: tetratricopeptide repeat protein [Bacteroidetes bacterium]|jgi:tetratricopeptide (TPR) repeat protein|nr:tetratricopeptide repeat protein [Bacteroidota bacterium]